jgi:hypothetical protein
MARRLELQQRLEQVLGSSEVYFQPPTNIQLQYPCIIYKRSRMDTNFADNNPYTHTRQYTVTIIARDPDTSLVSAVAALPRCTHDTFFTADNLNHDVFSLYF